MSPSPTLPYISTDNLALLYQGLLTSIVRVRSGSQPMSDCAAFRKRIRDVLTGVEREAIRLGYPEQDIRNTNYAIVAFLDEGILDSNDPSRHQWTSLQAELYGDSVAGESFFDQLTTLRNRRDSPQLADVLEVYYLCLLLGYQGRYAGYARERAGELRQIMEDLKERIDTVRGRSLPLSPTQESGLPRQPSEPSSTDSGGRTLRWGAIACIAFVVFLWIASRLLLASQVSEIRSTLS